MKIANLTPDQIANFLVRMKSQVEANAKLGVDISNLDCPTCRLLSAAFLKPEVMLIMLQVTFNDGDVTSVFFGMHLALEMMQALQEAEELEGMHKL